MSGKSTLINQYTPAFFDHLQVELSHAQTEEVKESICARVTVIADEAFTVFEEIIERSFPRVYAFDSSYDSFLRFEETLPKEKKELPAFKEIQRILFSIAKILSNPT